MSGTNHPNWTGTTNLNHYLRASILDDWKNKSLFSFKYKCIISNTSKDLIVHHLYPFASIINETVSRLKLNICNDISLYSEYELENLKKVCAEINFNYGLGVPLNKEIHNKFHSIYGKKNFTPENFQEFFYLETNKEIDLVNMNIKEVV
ncbi:hypothetical protein CJP46_02245 [Paenibacillus sp. XY044]|nr:hypothetical protein CJP46_02245 [Paenibacillus sp. XY044]